MRRNLSKTRWAKKVVKEYADIFADFSHPATNASINKNEFPSFLKLADVTPTFKKGSKNSKHNYRPISMFSKVYESYLFFKFSMSF